MVKIIKNSSQRFDLVYIQDNKIKEVDTVGIKRDNKKVTGIYGYHGYLDNFIGWILEIFKKTISIKGDDNTYYYLDCKSLKDWFGRVTANDDKIDIYDKKKLQKAFEEIVKNKCAQAPKNSSVEAVPVLPKIENKPFKLNLEAEKIELKDKKGTVNPLDDDKEFEKNKKIPKDSTFLQVTILKEQVSPQPKVEIEQKEIQDKEDDITDIIRNWDEKTELKKIRNELFVHFKKFNDDFFICRMPAKEIDRLLSACHSRWQMKIILEEASKLVEKWDSKLALFYAIFFTDEEDRYGIDSIINAFERCKIKEKADQERKELIHKIYKENGIYENRKRPLNIDFTKLNLDLEEIGVNDWSGKFPIKPRIERTMKQAIEDVVAIINDELESSPFNEDIADERLVGVDYNRKPLLPYGNMFWTENKNWIYRILTVLKNAGYVIDFVKIHDTYFHVQI